ncbi:MAG TPA: SDR family oxidoreductase [Pseudonocardiaceae bacterium]|jgi:3-oxoacyl-[acyl-carrier protein] reductase|nr:SDR family oxidoreductase [Pseudonocardiaceae bacterium]
MGALDGKAALVTGGSRGIGRAIVARLARDGATVVFSFAANKQAADDVVADGDGRVFAVRADQGSAADQQRLFDEAASRLGVLDILVNNAANGLPKPFLDVTPDEFDLVISTNTKGPFLAMQHAGRTMRDGGRIINISTVNTRLASPGAALYQASKGALEQLTKVAAYEFGGRGITVNIVSPGATDTELLRAANPGQTFESTVAMTALGRLGAPADVADVVAFLAGPDSRWITGQNIEASGGLGL